MAEITKKYAVVTGANKGIGFEICRQLISHGITVVLTARDEKKGLEAVEKLKNDGSDAVSNNRIIFHQLQVTDLESIASLAQFIKSQFGKLDILINNAGILGAIVDDDAKRALRTEGEKVNWNEIVTQTTYDLASECIETNYYGAKRTTEASIPLLGLSDSPRIVNVSSTIGNLKYIPSEWAKGILNDVDNLTEARIDEVLNEFLKDFKEGSLEAKGWPVHSSAYIVSKAAMNVYTRFLAKKYSGFRVNCACPGYAKTDINYNTGVLTVEESAERLVRLALLPNDGPSGQFFVMNEVKSFYE